MIKKLGRTVILMILLAALSASTAFGVGSESETFSDVPPIHWAHEAIQWAVSEGAVTGYPDGTFRPTQQVTEAEFLTMFIRTFDELPTPSNLRHWADPAYNYAMDRNWPVLGAASESVARNTAMTRETVANIISAADGKNLLGESAIQYILDQGYSSGKTSATVEGYEGDDLLTRAEAIQFIKYAQDKGLRYLNSIEKQGSTEYHPLKHVSFEHYMNGTWSYGASMHHPIEYAKTIRMNNDQLLIYYPKSYDRLHPQIYDPYSGEWEYLNQELHIESALLLESGSVLIVDKRSNSERMLVLMDPDDKRLTEIEILTKGWTNVDAITETDGKVVFFVRTVSVQCQNYFCASVPAVKPVYLDIATKEWDLNEDLLGVPVDMALTQYFNINDDEILLYNNIHYAVIYNVNTRTEREVTPIPFEVYRPKIAGLLPDGKILFAGGWKNSRQQTEDSFTYDPVRNEWSLTSKMLTARTGYASVTLSDGNLMLLGGLNNDAESAYLNSTTIYLVEHNRWVNGPGLIHSRDGAAAEILPDGRIIIAGGIYESSVHALSTEILEPKR